MEKIIALSVVCLGACIGSVLRWLIYSWVGRAFRDTFFATLTVNILGSFLIGIFFVIFSEIQSPRLQLLLMTGLLASFTTFSTLSLDAIRLLSNSQVNLAVSHIGGQIVFGIGFCYLGVKIGHYLFK